jgi:peptidoglycan/LPS O-acetylase OafA/YrhL
MGLLRFYLATCVFLWHDWNVEHRHVIYSFAAVYCFYIISGFYISMALDRNYADSLSGTLGFYANRALRLYPSYVVVMIVSAIGFRFGLTQRPVYGINNTFDFWALLSQITVFPKVIYNNLTLNTGPSTFGVYLSVGFEMIFYLLAPFFVRWKLPYLILLFVGSSLIHLLPFYLELPDRQWQYEFFPSLMVLFVAGSLSYRLYLAMKNDIPKYVGWLLPVGISLYGVSFDGGLFTNHFYPISIYASIALLFPFLFVASSRSKIDKLFGDLSYPFYVVHVFAIDLLADRNGEPTTNVPLTYFLAIALSFALLFLIERPIERARDKIRKSSREVLKTSQQLLMAT